MYSIAQDKGYLSVQFEEDFDLPMVQTIIHHLTLMPEYHWMNDVWIIGGRHSRISLCDLETVANELRCMCPKGAARQKTAVVVDAGLTKAILELWVGIARNHLPFELNIFHALEEAETWLDIKNRKTSWPACEGEKVGRESSLIGMPAETGERIGI